MFVAQRVVRLPLATHELTWHRGRRQTNAPVRQWLRQIKIPLPALACWLFPTARVETTLPLRGRAWSSENPKSRSLRSKDGCHTEGEYAVRSPFGAGTVAWS